MTYEAKRIKAQEKANNTGKETCIYETYEGYRIGFLTANNVGSAQEVFTPGRTTEAAAGYHADRFFLAERLHS